MDPTDNIHVNIPGKVQISVISNPLTHWFYRNHPQKWRYPTGNHIFVISILFSPYDDTQHDSNINKSFRKTTPFTLKPTKTISKRWVILLQISFSKSASALTGLILFDSWMVPSGSYPKANLSQSISYPRALGAIQEPSQCTEDGSWLAPGWLLDSWWTVKG